MKFLKKLFSNKSTRNFLIIVFVVLFLIPSLISYRPEPKVTRQIGRSSDDVQVLWTRNAYLWDYVTDWESNTIYAFDFKADELFAIDGLSNAVKWATKVPFVGSGDLLLGDQIVFTINSSYVTAFRVSTGDLLWQTKLGDGHVSTYAQEEDSLLRIYNGNKIIELLQKTGEIVSEQPKDNIVWIENNVEVQCPYIEPHDGAGGQCYIGLTGVDHATENILWRSISWHYSEYHQEKRATNTILSEFSKKGICVLNPNSGEYDWCLPTGRISNVAIDHDDKTGYYLRHDFSLVKVNLLTGGVLAETQFLPMSLPEGFLPEGIEKENYGYSVAVTKDTVIVSFRDSDQTFGLKINP